MKKITILDIQRFKDEGRKICMLTAYDCQIARILDGCNVDILLVGDSVGNVVMGLDNTLPVTMAGHASPCAGCRARPQAGAGGCRYAVHVLPGLD